MKENIDIYRWIKMSQREVLNKFHLIPTAFSDGKGQERFVYIEGTRADRVLIVAHADTVWNKSQVDIDVVDGKIISKIQNQRVETKHTWGTSISFDGIGIGADDRAGCSIAWEMVGSGHSILITSGEEIGCIATKRIIRSNWWKGEIKKHNFAVQFDRRHSDDIVFYDVGTDEFVDYVVDSTKYKPQSGSTTDIKHLCKDICGVNLSVGYYNEHTPREHLVLKEYENTLSVSREWLNKLNLPKFDKINKSEFSLYKSKYAPKFENYNNYHHFGQGDYGYGEYETMHGLGPPNARSDYRDNIIPLKKSSKLVVCKYCGRIMDQEEWFENYLICKGCHKEF